MIVLRMANRRIENIRRIILISTLSLISLTTNANEPNFNNYFVSIKTTEANMRTGPNVRYPILWVYKKIGEPLEVIGKFEHWRKARDIEGEEGWIYKGSLSNKRYVLINSKGLSNIFKKPTQSAKIVAQVENNALLSFVKCEEEWCMIKKDNIKGWVEKKLLWGV